MLPTYEEFRMLIQQTLEEESQMDCDDRIRTQEDVHATQRKIDLAEKEFDTKFMMNCPYLVNEQCTSDMMLAYRLSKLSNSDVSCST